MFHGTRSILTTTACLALLSGGTLLGSSFALESEDASQSSVRHQVAMSNQSSPGWAERLKGQTITENAVEGRAERAALVELQHQRLMDQMHKEMQHQEPNTGAYNTMSMMHQYGAGPENGLLASNSGAEPVSDRGGRCPATAPVKSYDISAINVEITLNQWLDYYPGYMYALTENIDKIREEEAKNAEARESEGHHDYASEFLGLRRRRQSPYQWIRYGDEQNRQTGDDD